MSATPQLIHVDSLQFNALIMTYPGQPLIELLPLLSVKDLLHVLNLILQFVNDAHSKHVVLESAHLDNFAIYKGQLSLINVEDVEFGDDVNGIDLVNLISDTFDFKDATGYFMRLVFIHAYTHVYPYEKATERMDDQKYWWELSQKLWIQSPYSSTLSPKPHKLYKQVDHENVEMRIYS